MDENFIPEPIQQPEPFQQEPPKEAKKFPKFLITILIIVGIIISGYFAVAKYQKLWPFELVMAPSPTPDGTANPALSEVEGWKTYRNEEYGFEVKYPENLEPKISLMPGIAQPSIEFLRKPVTKEGFIDLSVTINSTSLNDFLVLIKSTSSNFTQTNYSARWEDFIIASWDENNITSHHALIERSSKTYIVSNKRPYSSDEFNQILSTFKFIEPSTEANISNLNNIFGLSNKESGTKIYYSDKLGVGFTYVPIITGISFEVTVTEIGSKIYVHGTKEKPEQGQSIEVFTKEPNIAFQEAIKNIFLTGYSPEDCFVKTNETSEQGLSNYISATISFPPNTDPSEPWWQNADKCPQYYSETNAVQYFLMNKDVPGKFLFARIGQDSITSDGTPRTTEGGFNWSHSIRILK